MTSTRRSAQPHPPRPPRSEPLQDEVYRQMFRLEASRPGSALDLALALLRAWMAAESLPSSSCAAVAVSGQSPIPINFPTRCDDPPSPAMYQAAETSIFPLKAEVGPAILWRRDGRKWGR